MLLDTIPDKREDKNTTSLKMKQDLMDFFQPLDLKRCIEVVTFELDDKTISYAKEFNKSRDNITFIKKDVYKGSWDLEGVFDVGFIDCCHHYSYVKKDIYNCLKYGVKHIIFDDYGLPEEVPAVKAVVDELLRNEEAVFIKYVGEPVGNSPRVGKPLVDWEGIILKFA